MINKSVRPILSVCVPTYNRAVLLDKLLGQIFEFDSNVKSKIEVCISDNNSSDETSEVISSWGHHVAIKSVRQRTNIGASRNFQAVAGLSSAPWVILMGDDDLFCNEGIKSLLELLTITKSNTWVLADIANQDGTSLLQNFSGGVWSQGKFKRHILLDSLLDSLGFMSMHVIPRRSIEKFITLGIDEIYGWPHLALLFSEISDVEINVQRTSIVKRGGDGEEITQTWRSNDWLCLMMQKVKLCSRPEVGGKVFSTSMALREYVRWVYLRQTFHAMLNSEVGSRLYLQASEYINATKIHVVAKKLLMIYVWLLLLVPVGLISKLRKLKNPNAAELKKEDSGLVITDGMDRGL